MEKYKDVKISIEVADIVFKFVCLKSDKNPKESTMDDAESHPQDNSPICKVHKVFHAGSSNTITYYI